MLVIYVELSLFESPASICERRTYSTVVCVMLLVLFANTLHSLDVRRSIHLVVFRWFSGISLT